MKVRMLRPDGGWDEVEGASRVIDLVGDRDAPLADDTAAAGEIGLERTVYVNSAELLAVVIDETPGNARQPNV